MNSIQLKDLLKMCKYQRADDANKMALAAVLLVIQEYSSVILFIELFSF